VSAFPGVVDDDDLMLTMGRTIERYEAEAVDAGDCVLVHGDVGLHNLALDRETDTVNGIFDYDNRPGRTAITTSAISFSMSGARTCWTPPSRCTNPRPV
jgi:Ser/Thr protein kinase RdoA (MazF antagonist)